MKTKTLIFSVATFFGLSFAGFAKAVCPVCVIAVGAGLGFSRWLGIDDTISSLWIGGLLASLSAWTIVWLDKKNWKFKYYRFFTWAAYYALTLVPLYFYDIIGHPSNKIFGIDKIIFGAVLGTLVFLGGVWLHNFLKKKNGDKSYFPYQKVAVPVAILVAVSLVFYFVI